MPCSHCHQNGHNFRTCPTISPLERQRKIDENLLRRARNRNRVPPVQLNPNPNPNPQGNIQPHHYPEVIGGEGANMMAVFRDPLGDIEPIPLAETVDAAQQRQIRKNYIIANENEYEIAVYFSRNNHLRAHHFTYIEPHSSAKVTMIFEQHTILCFPLLSIVEQGGINAEKMIHMTNHPQNGESIWNDVKPVLSVVLKDIDEDVSTFIIPKKEYKPPKTELETWKETALKSNYLLHQIIKLGGRKNENIEPILDMVEDITVPPHTEYDKEMAGIPSHLTNVT